jgi:hypothetical protein
MIKEDYKTFISDLKCPNCGFICEDWQQDSQEEYKEEYCGNCDEQFGYEERVRHIDNLDDWRGEEFGQNELRYYWSYKI